MSSKPTTYGCESYTVAWIAALPLELAAATAVLDEEYERPADFEQHQHDTNTYTWGRVGNHNVVIASLPTGEYGTTIAATTASSLRFSLPQVRFGLMVGIGAGIPQLEHNEDVRFGDIVVSQPQDSSGGVIQYDLVKAKEGGKFLTGHLAMPPEALRKALAKLQAQHEMRDSAVPSILKDMILKFPKMAKQTAKKPGYVYQGAENDRLFVASSDHLGGIDCRACREVDVVPRDQRDSTDPEIHYGIIASGNTLVKKAADRDEILGRLPKHVQNKCLCIDMEAAGLMNSFPCMVIRGICDYGDSHKNDRWQRYAAATAAAFAKEFLSFVDAKEVKSAPELRDLLESLNSKAKEGCKIIKQTQSLLKMSTQRDQFEEIYRWLSPSDPSTNYNRALQQRFEGTGRWFVESKVFTSFKAGQLPFLWLNGIPGCGKTVLSSSIVENLQQDSPGAPPLHFYFDFNDNRRQTLESAIRSLLWQATTHSGSSLGELGQLYNSCDKGKNQPSMLSLIQTLRKALRKLDHARLVLDALDECATKETLLAWLAQLAKHEPTNVQIIVTSRKEYEFETEFGNWLNDGAMVSLQQLDVDVDIGSYIHARLQTDPQLQRWQGRPDVQDEIEEKLRGRANGMFRWASCQLDALAECLDYSQLAEALASLPPTLDDTYARILDRIPERHRQQSIRILQVLAWSERPLRVDEAVDFLAVRIDDKPGFDERNRMPVPREITRLCSSLVTIDSTKCLNDNKKGDTMTQEMRLSHFSVREYFTSSRLVERFRPSLSQTAAARCIASVSLIYLLHLGSQQSPRDKTRFPLSEYSARYWMSFVRLAGAESEALQRLTMQMLSDRRQYEIWRSMHDPDRPGEENPGTYNLPQPLYYVSMEGLENATCALLSDGADTNAQGGHYGNALQAACKGGHAKVVSMLLENSADVNTQGGHHGNALQAACRGGHDKVVSILLKKGADVNTQGGHHGNALQAACRGGHDKVALILLEKGANVDAQIGVYGNALQAACIGGYEKTVAILLVKGADVNSIGGHYGNALQAACQGGYEKVAAILLVNGAQINVEDGLYSTSLQAACQGGYAQLVDFLLKRGAKVNAQGGCYGNALQAACQGGHIQVVRLLIEGGANVNGQGGPFANALYAACYHNHDRVVELLLDEGADTAAQGGYYGNALQVVCSNNFERVMDMLIERGANVNSQGGEYGNALQAACARGHKKIAEVLIDEGARVNAQGGWYGNALQAACQRGHEELIRLLLMKDANVSAQGGWYGNALQAACHGGYGKVAKILLTKGADINAQGGWYGDALQAACHRGHEELVKMLLKQGADKNARGGRYGNALSAARSEGYRDIVSIL